MGKLLIAYFHMAEIKSYWKSHMNYVRFLLLLWDFQSKDI